MSQTPPTSVDPRVSVVVPVFNGEGYLQEALDSVFAQSYRDLEVIVVDDGSTDDTRHVLRRYGPRVRVIRQPNRGAAAARNAGIRAARGQLIAFQDHDDVWTPERLALQVPILDADRDVGLVYGDMADLLCDGARGAPRLREHHRARLSGEIFEYLLQWWVIGCPTVIVRHEVFDAVGLFDESFRICCSDWEMWLRVARRFRIAYVDAVVAYYRQHKTNLTRAVGVRRLVETQRRVLDKTLADPLTPRSALRFRRRAYGNIYYKAGRDLAAAGERLAALRFYLRALGSAPWLGPAWSGLARLCLGRRLRMHLRAAWTRHELGIDQVGPK